MNECGRDEDEVDVRSRDRIPNTQIRGSVIKVADLSKKIQEARLRWYVHVLRRDEEVVERRMMDT